MLNLPKAVVLQTTESWTAPPGFPCRTGASRSAAHKKGAECKNGFRWRGLKQVDSPKFALAVITFFVNSLTNFSMSSRTRCSWSQRCLRPGTNRPAWPGARRNSLENGSTTRPPRVGSKGLGDLELLAAGETSPVGSTYTTLPYVNLIWIDALPLRPRQSPPSGCRLLWNPASEG